jgi:glycosyltransferase involved in cell wall biosynthesis
MMDAPRVTVIIPTHNRAAFLTQAVESVQRQTFEDWELLIVDDGSTDITPQVMQECAAHDRRVRGVRQPNQGGAIARNVALRLARGEFIAFLDDDDEWLPTKLERQLEAVEQSGRIGLVACGAYRISPSEAEAAEWPDFHDEPPLNVLMRVGCIIRSFSGILFRRQCIETVGLLNPAYSVAHDFDFYLRLARVYDFAVVPEPLYRYRLHDTNISKNGPKVRLEVIQVLQAARPSADRANRRNVDRRLATLCYAAAVEAVDRHQLRQAACWYVQALRYNPLVGLEIKWTQHPHALYRAFRPYGAAVYFSLRSLVERGHPAPPSHATS